MSNSRTQAHTHSWAFWGSWRLIKIRWRRIHSTTIPSFNFTTCLGAWMLNIFQTFQSVLGQYQNEYTLILLQYEAPSELFYYQPQQCGWDQNEGWVQRDSWSDPWLLSAMSCCKSLYIKCQIFFIWVVMFASPSPTTIMYLSYSCADN